MCRLLWAFRDGSLSEDDAIRLQSLIRDDSQARELFVYYSFLCGSLEWDHSARLDEVEILEEGGVTAKPELESNGQTSQSPGLMSELPEIASSASLAFLLGSTPSGDITSLSPSPFQSHFFSNYFSQTGPLSFLISVMVMCLVGFVAWQYKAVDQWDMPTSNRPLVASSQEFGRTLVGRITGMVDCRWAKGELTPSILDFVAIGRRFKLDSGLFEITYDTGAKVIIQGPAIYEICSDGGFLASGKLAGKLERKGENTLSRDSKANTSQSGMRKSEEKTASWQQTSSRSSETYRKSLSIRTPAATVIDLGTEFGVEVDNEGRTTSHVFRGSIGLRPMADIDQQSLVLKENESVRVEMGNDLLPAMYRVAVEPDRFVRQMQGRKTPIKVPSTDFGVEEPVQQN